MDGSTIWGKGKVTASRAIEEALLLLGEEALEKLIGIQLYPNPCEESLFIRLNFMPEDGLIFIYSIGGRVKKIIGPLSSDYIELDLSELNSGTYLLELKNNQTSSFELFVKY